MAYGCFGEILPHTGGCSMPSLATDPPDAYWRDVPDEESVIRDIAYEAKDLATVADRQFVLRYVFLYGAEEIKEYLRWSDNEDFRAFETTGDLNALDRALDDVAVAVNLEDV